MESFMKKIVFLITLVFIISACENSVNLKHDGDFHKPDSNEEKDEQVPDETSDETIVDEDTQDNQPDETEDKAVVDTDIIWDNCSENHECEVGEMCIKKIGDCSGWGHCEELPEGCPEIFDPVCGCDDVTYSNLCEANRLYRNAKYSGECS